MDLFLIQFVVHSENQFYSLNNSNLGFVTFAFFENEI